MHVPELASLLRHENTKNLFRFSTVFLLFAVCSAYPTWKGVSAYLKESGKPIRITLSGDEGTMSLPETKGEQKLVLVVPPCGKDAWTERRYLSVDQSGRPLVLEARGAIAKAQLNFVDGSSKTYEPFSPISGLDQRKVGLRALRFENDYNQSIEVLLTLRPKKGRR